MFVGTLGEGIMIVWRARAAGRRRGRGRGGGGEGRGCRGRDQWNVNAFLLTKKLERKMSFEVSVCAEDIRFSMRAAASQRSLVAFCFVVETFDFSSSFSSFFFFALRSGERKSLPRPRFLSFPSSHCYFPKSLPPPIRTHRANGLEGIKRNLKMSSGRDGLPSRGKS